jgi:aminoglycoside 2''-phosphotransferase
LLGSGTTIGHDAPVPDAAEHQSPADRLSTYVGLVATAWDGSFGRDAVRLHEGQDHDVVLVGTAAAFRFPRHEHAHQALGREVAALALLERTQIAAVLPHVLLDCSAAPLGRAFVGHAYLPGEPLPRASVDAVGPMAYRFAAELARVLDTLAAVEVTADLTEALQRSPMRATWEAFADAVRHRLPDADHTSLDAVLALDPPPEALVHGDFTGRNLRWDADETRLTGVLDWAQVHLGDPAYDIASVAATYGWDLAATVDAATSRDDPTLVERARAYAATFDLQRALATAP